jgi:hypothetical protein
MSVALYSTFRDRDLAERIVGTLLDAGVIPEDISLVTRLDEDPASKLVPNYEPALRMVDAGKANLAEMRYGTVAHEDEGSELYESHVGGGISTTEPDDDVSGPEEMDDSESVSEDLSQPARGVSFGSEEFRDADSFAEYGSLNVLQTRKALDSDPAVAPIEEISAIAEPGLLILGDGHLALELLRLTVNGNKEPPQTAVIAALCNVGVPDETARTLVASLEGKGAILSVVETIGMVPIERIEAIVESTQAEETYRFDIEMADKS